MTAGLPEAHHEPGCPKARMVRASAAFGRVKMNKKKGTLFAGAAAATERRSGWYRWRLRHQATTADTQCTS